jgi:hypothetical protein
MTPKEKAYDLVQKFKRIDESEIYGDRLSTESAKECAIIAVDEILQGDHLIRTPLSFWKLVKVEIENL